MKTIEEMKNWNYETACNYFSENAFHCYIPETELYITSLETSPAEDLRGDKQAYEKIMNTLSNKKTLILVDGSSLNGKTTFAQRLVKKIKGNIIDIDLICKDWIEKQISKITNPIQRYYFLGKMDELTDIYIIKNLENIVKDNSKKGSVILVGCYMEPIFRTIVARTLGKYFNQVVSIYFCAKSFDDIKKLKNKRDEEFGFSAEDEETIFKQYEYSKELVDFDQGIMLGFGMTKSFISDSKVSDMF